MADAEIQREAVLDTLDNAAERLAEEREYLTDLDSAIDDADHGVNMECGFGKATDKREEFVEVEPNEVVKDVGTTLISNVGGASGPFYGDSIMFANQELKDGITAESLVAFAEAYPDKVKGHGGVQVDAKTMVDALVPAVHTCKKSIEQDDLPPLEALAEAVDAAERGVAFAVPIKVMRGHASFLDWRLVGHQDPDAASTLFILEELLETIGEHLGDEVDRDARAEDAAGRGE